MTYEEKIEELKWVRENGFVADKDIIGTGRIIESIDSAIVELKKAEKYQWHDLRKNPEDLPMDKGIYLIAYRRGKRRNIHYADAVFYGHRWCVLDEIKVLGWKCIEPF